MNPLKLDKQNRAFYDALVELHHVDPMDKEAWLKAYRRMRDIKKLEGRNVIPGWKCFIEHYTDLSGSFVALGEKFFR